jgi:hypothetical protein
MEPLVAALLQQSGRQRKRGLADAKSDLAAVLMGEPNYAVPTRTAATAATTAGEAYGEDAAGGARRLGLVLGPDGKTPRQRELEGAADPAPVVEAPKPARRQPRTVAPMEPWATPETVDSYRPQFGDDAEDMATLDEIARRGKQEQLTATARTMAGQRGQDPAAAAADAERIGRANNLPVGKPGAPRPNPIDLDTRIAAQKPILHYTNQGATRNQPITDTLAGNLQEAIGAVYGPGYTAQVYSGGQHGNRRTGSIRHDGGKAADIYIVDPLGQRLQGDALAPLAQYWKSKNYGGVGLEMRGGGVHLDEHDHTELNRRGRGGYGPHWSYGTRTPAQRAAVEAGMAGQAPELYANGRYVRPGTDYFAEGAPRQTYGGTTEPDATADRGLGAPQQPLPAAQSPAMAQRMQAVPMQAAQTAQAPQAAPAAMTRAAPAQQAPNPAVITPSPVQPPETTEMGSAMPATNRERLARLLEAAQQGMGQADSGMTAPETLPIRRMPAQTSEATTAPIVQGGSNIRPVSFTPQQQGGVPGAESIDRRRQLSEAMLAQSAGMKPIRHPLQGIAQMTQAGVGALGEIQAQQAAEQRRQALTQALMGASGTDQGGDLAQLFQVNPEAAFQITQQRQQAAAAQQQAQMQRQQEVADRQARQQFQMQKLQEEERLRREREAAGADRFEPMQDEQGNIIGQRNLTTGGTDLFDRPESFETVRDEQGNIQHQVNRETGRIMFPPAGTNVTVNNNEGGAAQEDELRKKLLGGMGTGYAALYDAGVASQRGIQQIDRLEGLLADTPGGFANGLLSMASTFGIEIAPEQGPVEAADAIISQLVPQQRPPGSGVMSDADLALYRRSLPRLMNTPEGNALIIEGMRSLAQYNIETGAIVAQYGLGNLSLEEMQTQLSSVANPFEGFRGALTSLEGGQQAQPAPARAGPRGTPRPLPMPSAPGSASQMRPFQ